MTTPSIRWLFLVSLALALAACDYRAEVRQVHLQEWFAPAWQSPIMDEGGALVSIESSHPGGTQLWFTRTGMPSSLGADNRRDLPVRLAELVELVRGEGEDEYRLLAWSAANQLMIIGIGDAAVVRAIVPDWTLTSLRPRINPNGDIVARSVIADHVDQDVLAFYNPRELTADPPPGRFCVVGGLIRSETGLLIDRSGRAIALFTDRVARIGKASADQPCDETVLYAATGDLDSRPIDIAIDGFDNVFVLTRNELRMISAADGTSWRLDRYVVRKPRALRVNSGGDIAVALEDHAIRTRSRDGGPWREHVNVLARPLDTFVLNTDGLVAYQSSVATTVDCPRGGPAIFAQSARTDLDRARVCAGDPLPGVSATTVGAGAAPRLLGYGPHGVVFWVPERGIYVSPSADAKALIETASPASLITAMAVPAAPATLGFDYRFLSEATTLEVFLQGVKLCAFDAPVPLQADFAAARCPIDPARFEATPPNSGSILRFTIDGVDQAVAIDHLTLDGVLLPEGDFTNLDPDTGDMVGFVGTKLPLDVYPLDPAIPVVTAGADQTVLPGETVVLSGVTLSLTVGVPTTSWTQVEGPPVTLSSPDVLASTFVAPATPVTLRFVLTATLNGQSASDSVRVTVQAPAADGDGDGVADAVDNCFDVPNPGQSDVDHDGAGDPCDPCAFDAQDDADGDGACADVDSCPAVANPDQADLDGDHAGDACDPDDDGDDVPDAVDDCPTIADPGQENSDDDALGDACDPDDDGDGVLDGADACAGSLPGAPVDGAGCGLDQLCPCAGPRGGDDDWANHGAYVTCVRAAAADLVARGVMTPAQRGAAVAAAAQSSCGRQGCQGRRLRDDAGSPGLPALTVRARSFAGAGPHAPAALRVFAGAAEVSPRPDGSFVIPLRDGGGRVIADALTPAQLRSLAQVRGAYVVLRKGNGAVVQGLVGYLPRGHVAAELTIDVSAPARRSGERNLSLERQGDGVFVLGRPGQDELVANGNQLVLGSTVAGGADLVRDRVCE